MIDKLFFFFLLKHNYRLNKNILKLKKQTNDLFLQKQSIFVFLLKKIFFNSKRVIFSKKFTCSIVKKKKLLFIKSSMCYISGKFRSNIQKISLKRHVFKKILTHNIVPNIIKKYK